MRGRLMDLDVDREIDEIAREVAEVMLAETILHLIPYLEPGEMDSVSYQHMEDELSPQSIERATERMIADLRLRIRRQIDEGGIG